MIAAILFAEASSLQWVPVGIAGGIGAIVVFLLMRFLDKSDA